MNRREAVAAGVTALVATGCSRVPWMGGSAPEPGVRPSRQQLAWQQASMGMFFHFGVNTFSDREWGLGNEDPASFNPVNLDTRQWVRAAKSAGFKYVVLTAKHHDGFCLWPSRVTEHSVKSSPWRGGQGDVVREVADATRAAGLGLGLYLSPWDRNAASYGSGEAYSDFYIAQLTELLTNYGRVTEVWFDGANGEGPNGKKQKYDWARIHATVRRLQPDALMFSDAGPDIRWIGNENGKAGDPNWCTVDPSIVTEPGLDGPEIIRSLQHGDAPPKGTVWRPGEADVSIRPGWFHHESEDGRVKSEGTLMELWFNSVGRGANLLLNVPPARNGLLATADLSALEAFGTARRAYWADSPVSGRVRRDGATFSVTMRRAARIRAVGIGENIAAGQHVARYRVDALTSAGWTVCARGTTVGHLKVDRFDPVVATGVRVAVEESVGTPTISSISAAVLD